MCFAAAQTVRTIGPFDVSFYNNGQGDSSGTSNGDWSAEQMDAVAAAIAAWSSRLPSTPTRQITLRLFWNSLDSGTLGQTESPRLGNGTNSWTYPEYIWRDRLSASYSGGYDARMSFNSTSAWSFTATGPDFSRYDFRSTMTHEIGHSLGFLSTYTYNPNNQTGNFSNLGFAAWDKRLQDAAGHRPTDQSPGYWPSPFDATGTVWFTGPAAVAANGGNVAIYAPTLYSDSSSLSHLDGTTFPSALLRPAFGTGTTTRAPTSVEWAMMQDMGWTVGGAKYWTKGAGTLAWGTTGNWSPGGVPDQNASVTFTNTGLAANDSLPLGASRSVQALTFDTGTDFSIVGTGTLSIRGGNLVRTPSSSGTQTISCPVTMGANGIWSIEGPGKLVLSGTVSSSYPVYKSGLGMVVITGATTLANDMVLDDGDLTLGTGGTLTARNIYGNGSLNFDGGSLGLTGSSTISLRGIRVGKEGPGGITMGKGSTLTAGVFLTIGRDSGGQGQLTNQGAVVNASTNLFVGVFPGSYGYYVQQTDTASGTLPTTTVASATAVGGDSFGDNGGIGLIEIASGTFSTKELRIGPSGSSGGGSGTMTQTGGTVTVSGLLELAGGETGTYNLNGGTLATGQLTKGTGTAAFNFGGGTLKATGAFTTTVPWTVNAGGAKVDSNGLTVTAGGTISGVGGLQKLGSGTLTLGVANTFGGETTIKAGTLALANGNALQSSTVNLASGDIGTLSFGSLTAASLGGLKGQRDLSLPGSLMLSVGGNGSSNTYSGSLIATSATLNKTGSGTLALSGNNAFLGGMTVSAGTLQIGTAANLAAGAVNLAGGTLNIQSSTAANLGTKNVNVTANSAISTTGVGSGISHSLGGITFTGNRTLTLVGDSGLTTGAVSLNDAATIANNAAGVVSLGSLQETAVAARTVTFSGSGQTVVRGAVTQNGANPLTLLKTGSGKLTLTGSDTYTGGTLVTGGTLEFGSLNAVPRGGALTIGAGARIVLASGLSAAGAEAAAVADVEVVPEPSTFDLLVAGAAVLGMLLRRKVPRRPAATA